MGITLRTAAYGREATATLAELLEQLRGGDPLAPATVLVPTNYIAVAARRALAELSPRGIAGVSFSTLYRLAELLGAPALAGRGLRPVSTPVLVAAIRAVLAESPGVFELTREHPATEKTLLASHRELSNLDKHQLELLASQSRKAADVVRIHSDVEVRLRRHWYQEQDLLAAATAAVAESAPALESVGPVVVYLPERFTPAQEQLLKGLASSRPVVLVAALTGDGETDTAALAPLENLAAPSDLQATVANSPPVGDRVLSVSDADDEVRTVVREVVDAARWGVPFDRMALLYASDQPYARLLQEQLSAAEIPHNGAALGTLADSLVGRTALGLLTLRERDYHRAELFALLNSAPVRHEGRLAPVASWERISRTAGVVRGAAQWDQRLTVLMSDLRLEFEAADGDPDEGWRAPGIGSELRRTEQLWAFVARLIEELERSERRSSWSSRCRWLAGALRKYLGGDTVREAWPEHERSAGERIDAALERLSGLDEIEPRPTLGAFTRTFELELEAGLGRSGRFGEGVLVGALHMGVGLDLDHVWILGMAEGLLPSRPRDDSLLPDRERAVTAGALRTRRERLTDQRRHFLAALGAAEHRTLSFPRGDLRRSNERMPSRWLLEAAGRHEGRRVFSPDLGDLADRDWFTESASQVAGLLAVSRPPSVHEYDVVSVLASRRRGVEPERSRLAEFDVSYRRGLDLLLARASAEFTRFDGNLAGVHVPAPSDGGQVVSATRLETWSQCPHAYLMRYLLGVQPVETPEAVYSLGALERGSLVHAALDKWLSEVLEAGDRGEPWTEGQRRRLLELGDEQFAYFRDRGLVGGSVRRRFDQRAILADLSELIDRDNARRSTLRTRTLASEMGFGLPRSDADALPYELNDGRGLTFRGSADRVEVDGEGELLVIDYKTGSDYRFRELSETNPDMAGTKLQLPVYAAAARRAYGAATTLVRAAYWFITSKRDFKLIELSLTPEVLDRVDTVLSTIVDGIGAGVFPPHPDKDAYRVYNPCPYCDPDDLGTRDRRREWERKAAAPELRPYLRLADPDLAAVYDSVGLQDER